MSEQAREETSGSPRSVRGLPSVMAARILATAMTALFIYMGMSASLDESSAEVIALFLLFGLAAASVLVAWWKAAPGVGMLALAGIALAVFFAVVGGDNRVLLALVFGGPYLLSALVLWFGLSRRARA